MISATLTGTFAMLIGLMSIAAGIGALLRPGEWQRMFDEFEGSPGLLVSVAFIAIVFGAVVVLLHPLWDTPLQIAVSLIGWLSFVEGLALLAIPRQYISVARLLLPYGRAWAIVSLLIGIVLFVAGIAEHSATIIV